MLLVSGRENRRSSYNTNSFFVRLGSGRPSTETSMEFLTETVVGFNEAEVSHVVAGVGCHFVGKNLCLTFASL